MPACCAGQPTGVENRGDAPRLPVFLTGAMPALGLLALPTLWASSSIRGVDHPSVARLVKDWAQSTWLTKGSCWLHPRVHLDAHPVCLGVCGMDLLRLLSLGVLRNYVVGPQIPGGIPLLGPAPGVHPVLVEAQSLCAMALALCRVGSLDLALAGLITPRVSLAITLPRSGRHSYALACN